MRPLKLEFCGINSFSEHTIIDFEKLTKSGIFGIFGDTGSGKSTILDCINFALFGDVERSREKTDIINYRCNSASVKFTFDIMNEGRRKIYTVFRVLKNDKNASHKATLYCNDGGTDLCIAEKTQAVAAKVVEILGVDADDFRKCIALPQGEFAQFVKSAPRDRLALIERLFNLSRYGNGLKDKINIRQGKLDGEYLNLEGKLAGYEGITESGLKDAQKRKKDALKSLKELEELSKKQSEKLEKLKNLAAKRAEFDEILREIAKLEALRPEMDELRSDLKILPACRKVGEISADIGKKRENLVKLKADLSVFEHKTAESVKLTETLEKRLSDGCFDDKISECEKLGAVCTSLEGKPEKLKQILKELENKRSEYSSADAELKKLAVSLKGAEDKVCKAGKSLEELGENDLEYLINVKFKGAVLRDEYAEKLGYFTGLKAQTEKFEDDSEFYKFISGEISDQIAEYSERLNDVRDFRTVNINEDVKKIQDREAERERRLKELEKCKRESAEINNSIKLCESRRAQLYKEGVALRERADEISCELKKVFGDSPDYAKVISENEKRLLQLKKEKKAVSDSLDRERENKLGLEKSSESVKTLMRQTEADLKELEQKLESYIVASRLESAEKCISLADRFSSFTDAEKSLSEYDGRLSAYAIRRDELLKTEDILNADSGAAAEAENEKAQTDVLINQLHGELAVAEKIVSEVTEKLEQKRKIQAEYERVSRERSLLYQLKDVVKNNKFLEYIANEYLCDISALASSTLLNLTDGRYFLRYKDNNFSVGDNFDCGNLRGVNTLSGGETFLVSLSLALALSQTICSRSMKSIEFFFLDEGFGTLDSTLVDVVMNALEKLKSSNFTIGVISHVEELKHRIENKITVLKATENHGSTLQTSL